MAPASRRAASLYSARRKMYATSLPVAYAVRTVPSINWCGSPSRSKRSLKVPGAATASQVGILDLLDETLRRQVAQGLPQRLVAPGTLVCAPIRRPVFGWD